MESTQQHKKKSSLRSISSPTLAQEETFDSLQKQQKQGLQTQHRSPTSSQYSSQNHQSTQFHQRPTEVQRSLSGFQQHRPHNSPTNTQQVHRLPSNTTQRISSFENAYSPVRTPSTSQRISKSRSSSSSKPSQFNQYALQERAYLKKMRNDTADDYYTKAIISDPTESDADSTDDDNGGDEEGQDYTLENDTVGKADFEMDIHQALDPSLLENGEENPKFLERLEWQTMLSLVLNGDVVSSEKRRIITQNDFSLQTTYKENLWLGIKAYVLGRSEEQQKRIIGYSRSFADDVFSEILNFRVQDEEKAIDEVKEILEKLSTVKELWRDEKEMAHDKPVVTTEEFVHRVEALISWKNITSALNRELRVLKEWTQSDDLDITAKRSDGFTDSSFADAMLKEKDISNIFRSRIFRPYLPWINKSKASYLQYEEIFEELNLPSFIPQLAQLFNFPLRLIQETLKVRLAYARKLDNPTMMMIDEMIEDFSSYIELAVSCKNAEKKYNMGWNVQLGRIEGFDKTVLDAIKYLYMLIHRKLINTTSKSFRTFREPDDLEQCWSLMTNVGCFIEDAGPEVASQTAALTARLISRLVNFIHDQPGVLKSIVENPESSSNQKTQEITTWSNNMIDSFGTVRRKLAKFATSIRKAFSNAALFQINRVKPFLELLRDSGHFLLKTSYSSGTYILASKDLYGRDEAIVHILKGIEIGSDVYKPRPDTFILDEYEEETDMGYVVVINVAKAMLWDGLIVNIDNLPEMDYEIKPGEVLLINQGSSSTLKQTKTLFSEIVGDSLSYVEQRSSLAKVQRDLIRSERLFFKLVLTCMSEFYRCKQRIQKVNKNHDSLHMLFCFNRDLAKNYIKSSDSSRKAVIVKRMIEFSIDWVSFIVDDCIPTDKKTFRWCVTALEFAMKVSKGFNILTLKDEQFTLLKEKVAGCMSLLISHFDIMGARSSEAEKKSLNVNFHPTTLQTDAELLQAFSDQTMRQIAQLEDRMTTKTVGKVLDDTQTENQFLTFLASSFSSLSIRWQKRKFIGGGTFGSVYSALNLDTGGVLAVKEIRLHDSQSTKQIVPTIKDEMTVLEMLNHPNIVQYYGVEVHRDKVNIFMEFCEGGSLASLLEHGRIEDELVIQVYTLQMFEGLAYLHEMKIVHRDIKPENILLDHNGIIKFVDFGAAKVAKNLTRKPATNANSMTGTPMYMSPEVITGGGSAKFGAVDVWSTGCCVLEMTTGRRPWANLDNEWAIMYHIAAGHLPQFPTRDQLSDMGFNFLHRCLEQDPNKRSSAAELLQDPWMLDIRAKAFSDGSVSSNSEHSSDYGG